MASGSSSSNPGNVSEINLNAHSNGDGAYFMVGSFTTPYGDYQATGNIHVTFNPTPTFAEGTPVTAPNFDETTSEILQATEKQPLTKQPSLPIFPTPKLKDKSATARLVKKASKGADKLRVMARALLTKKPAPRRFPTVEVREEKCPPMIAGLAAPAWKMSKEEIDDVRSRVNNAVRKDGGIHVITWEDRPDLMQVIVVGSSATAYGFGLFLDLYLSFTKLSPAPSVHTFSKAILHCQTNDSEISSDFFNDKSDVEQLVNGIRKLFELDEITAKERMGETGGLRLLEGYYKNFWDYMVSVYRAPPPYCRDLVFQFFDEYQQDILDNLERFVSTSREKWRVDMKGKLLSAVYDGKRKASSSEGARAPEEASTRLIIQDKGKGIENVN